MRHLNQRCTVIQYTNGKSFYKPSTLDPKFRPIAEKKVIDEAKRQIAAAEAQGLTVEWLVSDQTVAAELRDLFNAKGINVTVTYLQP